ncbi:MAG: M20 family metallopeptidase [Desulfobacterales bacterium]|nr:M20 family metallopeptidase [Desulfobacterales bacterium]
MNQTINTFIMDNTQALLTLLEELVLIQSFSRNKAGVDRVGDRIAKEFAQMGFEYTFKEEADLGNNLIVRSPWQGERKNQILITGHMDTVFPENSGFNWYKESDTRCFGPGVADMKGGLVVGIFALKALIHSKAITRCPITFIFNSDEEIGSPTSRSLIAKEAARSRVAYVLEAGGVSNEIVSGRKGNFSMQMTIDGKAGHAAFAGNKKASAILEMAHKTLAIESMNDPDKGLSANVGTIKGGIGPNTVPDKTVAKLDFRYLTQSQANFIQDQISRLTKKTFVPGTHTSLEIKSSRPSMPQTDANKALFKKIENLSQELGKPVIEELRQGVSDANIIADQGTPVIDGLGPIGAKDHSEEEYIEKASLWERCTLFAHILAEI